jgi:hypothetical protein
MRMELFMRWWMLLLALWTVSPVQAETPFWLEPLYFGGGFGNVRADGVSDRRTTIHTLLGYRISEAVGLDSTRNMLALEIGYQDTSLVRHDGNWAAVLLAHRIMDQVEVLVRGGRETGHYNDSLWGVGFGFWFDRNVQIRVEYSERDGLKGTMFSLVAHPWWKRPYKFVEYDYSPDLKALKAMQPGYLDTTSAESDSLPSL